MTDKRYYSSGDSRQALLPFEEHEEQQRTVLHCDTCGASIHWTETECPHCDSDTGM